MKTNMTQLDTFLASIKTSNYSRLVYEQLQGIEATEGVTGAADPLLPMTIAIADSANNRLEVILLINPLNLNHGKASMVGLDYTRKGYISQVWGPRQDTLTATGTTAAFMFEGEGLTVVNRRSSMAMKNFFALLYAYRNNGYDHTDPTAYGYGTRVINVIHGVEISYDNQNYMGHFNNFTIDENAEKPFLFDYNFDFVVSSLSADFNEIRGHYIPIGVQDFKPVALLRDVKGAGFTVLNSTLISSRDETPNTPGTETSAPTQIVDASSMDDLFKKTALPMLLKFEGGYVNNPNDPGGATNKGITQRTYNAYLQRLGLAPNSKSVADITDKEVQDIYYTMYWKTSKCDQLSPTTAMVMFDTAVHCGPGQAAKFIQRASSTAADGVMGTETLTAVSKTDTAVLNESILQQRVTFYNNRVKEKPSQGEFLEGWTERVKSLRNTVNTTSINLTNKPNG